jgi:hypothetical protein
VGPEAGEVADPVVIRDGMLGIGAGDGYAGDEVAQIDPTTGAIVRRVLILDIGSRWGGDPGIDAGDVTVWMAGGHALNRIDLS